MATAPSIGLLLRQRSAQRLVPISVMLEVTYRCNLSCRYCYLDGEPEPSEPLLSTEEVIGLLDQLAAAGTLHLTISGGEPLLRNDLWTILQAAAERSFAIHLFTNGTLIDGCWANRFGRLGTLAVEISLHGACAETHDWMTRTAGSFDRVLAVVPMLRDQGVPVTLKSVLTRQNYGEAPAIRALAERLGATLVIDAVVSARNCGAQDTWCLRLERPELVDLYGTLGLEKPGPGPAELMCNAGVSAASITPVGVVRPCVQLLLEAGRLREQSFADIWTSSPTLKTLRALSDIDLGHCMECAYRALCNRCPGLALLEDGNMLGPSTACCQMALAMAEVVGMATPDVSPIPGRATDTGT